MILLTAATPWESRPLAAALSLSPCSKVHAAWCGDRGGTRVLLVRTGMGPERAEAALEALGDLPFELAVSAGLAGALQPAIEPGDAVCDPHGAPLPLLEAAREAARGAAVALHLGRIVSTNRVLGDPAAKRALGEARRAVAVDMESGAIRRWAVERGIPFLALRGVLDGLDDAVPTGAPEGEDAASLLAYAARHWRELPLLLGTGRRARRGMRRLAAVLDRFLWSMPACTRS